MHSRVRIISFAAAALAAGGTLSGQETTGAGLFSRWAAVPLGAPPVKVAEPFDRDMAMADDAARAAQGKLPLYARFVEVEADLAHAGEWTELPGGDRVWRLGLRSDGALATELIFSEARIPNGAQLHVYSPDGEELHGGYTTVHTQSDGSLSTDMTQGDACVVEYYEPAAVRGEGSLRLQRLLHAYRFADQLSGACNVDVNCPEGSAWQDQRDAVVRVRVVIASGAGFCTGTLMNNTALDCKGYILTAFHCTEDSQESHYPSYQFRFNYQRTTCGTGSATGNGLTGCNRRAGSQDQGGIFGSDFTLLELTAPIPSAYQPYWAGWDIGTSAPLNGVCIHHPDADVKKVSTFTTAASNATWAGNTSGSHWMVTWAQTSSGHGVTEVGSSGSPLFNTSKRVVGSLTGGASCCTTNGCGAGTSLTSPDFFGKMSFHFGNSNPNPANERLKAWLSPVGTPTFLEGSRDPCTPIGITEAEIGQLSISPNPVSGIVRVSLPQGFGDAGTLQVNDLSGRLVHELRMVSDAALVDVSGLPPGIYHIAVRSEGRVLAVGRIAVER